MYCELMIYCLLTVNTITTIASSENDGFRDSPEENVHQKDKEPCCGRAVVKPESHRNKIRSAEVTLFIIKEIGDLS